MLTIKRIWFFSVLFGLAASLSGCGGDGSGGGGRSMFDASSSADGASSSTGSITTDGTYQPALSGSPYSSVLVGCVKNSDTNNPCTLGTLPFIGQNHPLPTKADILAQTVVSHPWMAQRFSDLLDAMPNDIFLLFRGVTAVVIAHDIRPSYYTGNTGAIYLDPADLWITASERATIDKAEDFRSNFGSSLQFLELWRYVKNGDYAWDYYGLNSTVASRPFSDSLGAMMWLLFHELAHANDFMPPSALTSVNTSFTPWQQVSSLGAGSASNYLTAALPLNSQMLKDLGQVLYHGVAATPAQKQLRAGDVGAYFAADGANSNYSYSTQYEDTAELFEEVMMKYHYNADREEAFSDQPVNVSPKCADYIIRWGQRNRIASPSVKARAQLIVGRILGKNDISIYFNNLPAPRDMIAGVDWCTNLTTMGSAPLGSVQQKMQNADLVNRPIRETDFHHPAVIK